MFEFLSTLRLRRTTVKFALSSSRLASVSSSRGDVHHADRVVADAAGQPAAADDRHLLPVDQADAAAVEQVQQSRIVGGRFAAEAG